MDGLMSPELMASDGFHPGPGLYARVAEHLAEVIGRDGELGRFDSRDER
jgi:lysophospholipase L1-like esterase